MMKSIQAFVNDFFHNAENEDERGRQARRSSVVHNDMGMRIRKKSNKIRNAHKLRPKEHGNRIGKISGASRNVALSKRYTNKSQRSFSTFFKFIKSMFSNDEQNLRRLKNECSNIYVNSPNLESKTNEEYRKIKNRIESSDAFKRKLNELKYDRTQIEKIRKTTRLNKHARSPRKNGVLDDRLKLLNKEVQDLKRRLHDKSVELELVDARLDTALKDNKWLRSRIADMELTEEKGSNISQHKMPHISTSFKDSLQYSSPTKFKRYDSNILESDEIKDILKQYGDDKDYNSDDDTGSLSPIRIDYSKYSGT
ncbi:hypothetical protein KAFR_0A03080 [Kazachstania africana CBS 2517]|uniref:Uncharacterized protein n=1 Tax=Kazachstania africana (strain ATCC 22294 / BCRC 22015 / CBS 2517 / CECT 1963 / NBRC 1671 / NRRL Y-8276) TaxID=1071382 RepID=H2AMZ3_KAZAF|nr:hypothetical protein KAFR_0A03080 [Kazachstania africana CBS 2517]CCF55743.1 hypothetical protein KAFR_0A03080 [Kazachstania africana CBS 2517]